MKKALKIILPILLVLALGCSAVYAYMHYEPYNLRSIQKDPNAQIQKSIKKTGEALKAGLAFSIPESVSNAFTTGSISLILQDELSGRTELTAYPRENALTLAGKAGEEEFGFWFAEDAIVAHMPTLSGGKAYGINPQNLKNDMNGSALLDLLGISYEDFCTIIDSMQTTTTQEDGSTTTDWSAKLEMKRQLNSLLNSAAVAVEEGNLPIDTQSVEVYRVSYTFGPEQMCSAMDLLANYIMESNSFKQAMKETPDLPTQLTEEINNIKQMMRDSNSTAIICFYLHKESQVIVHTDIRMDWLQEKKGASVIVSLSLGADPAQAGKYVLSCSSNVPGQPKQDVSLTYNRSHAHNLPGRTLVLKDRDGSTTLMDLQINSLTGAFDINLMDRQVSFSGVCVTVNDVVTITANMDENNSLTLAFTGKDDAPTVPKYINICRMSKDELAALLDKFEMDEPYEPDTSWKVVDLSITGSDGSTGFYYMTHDYTSLGELLAEEGIAMMNSKTGKIEYMCDKTPGAFWDVYINGKLYEGNLFEYTLSNEEDIAIIGR